MVRKFAKPEVIVQETMTNIELRSRDNGFCLKDKCIGYSLLDPTSSSCDKRVANANRKNQF